MKPLYPLLLVFLLSACNFDTAKESDQISDTDASQERNTNQEATQSANDAIDDSQKVDTAQVENSESASEAIDNDSDQSNSEKESDEEQVNLASEAATSKDNGKGAKISHQAFDELLKNYVTESGRVSYKGLLKNKSKLDSYTSLLSKNTPQRSWSSSEELAYWINAYNAYTLKLIVDHYPVKSITDIKNGKPWDDKWIKIGDKTYSLNNIEHDIIRPRFEEPRIHFAVNCAAKSCPKLLNRAYTALNLEDKLTQQTEAFINNTQMNTISNKKVKLSKIFEWYGEDFEDLIGFINRYSTTKVSPKAQIEYAEYNWSLNE